MFKGDKQNNDHYHKLPDTTKTGQNKSRNINKQNSDKFKKVDIKNESINATNFNQQDDDKFHQMIEIKKTDKVNNMIGDAQQMRRDVREIGNLVEQDNQRLRGLNTKIDGMTNRAQRNLNKMQRFLEKTSNCQLYVILGVQLFIFIVLMSL